MLTYVYALLLQLRARFKVGVHKTSHRLYALSEGNGL